ncbi:MAG: hydrogenase 3 maturation endopeptidase HyCI [Planctomycetes bacterium]|nr:hydrogenase 3 maturation endopeptidase HyCI [Planctomycetota bacterium]
MPAGRHAAGCLGALLSGGEPELAAELEPLLAKRWLLIGIGSDLRGDDAFGPLLARTLARRGRPALDAGLVPESYTGPILRFAPEVLILADAAEIGLPPGSLRLLPGEAIAEAGASTHDSALSLVLTYLLAQHEMEVRVLAAQPASRELGEEPGPAMREALHRAAALFKIRED